MEIHENSNFHFLKELITTLTNLCYSRPICIGQKFSFQASLTETRSFCFHIAGDGIIFAWGFGSDGQLGLGERKLTSSSPRRIRHESLRHRVSFIGCGETYSAAITGKSWPTFSLAKELSSAQRRGSNRYGQCIYGIWSIIKITIK